MAMVVDQAVRDETADPTLRAANSIEARAQDHLAAIAALLGELQDATDGYRGRPLDWGDVTSLRRARQYLAEAAEGFAAAEAAAALTRAAREVASQIRSLRAD